MDPVTSAQFDVLKESFTRRGFEIEAALTDDDELDYIYVVGRLLVVDRNNNVNRLLTEMPGLRRADTAEQTGIGNLVRLSIDQFSTDD